MLGQKDNYIDWLNVMAYTLYENQKPHQAARLWEGVLALDRENHYAALSISFAYYESQKWEKAIAKAQSYLKRYPDHTEASQVSKLLGQAYWAKGEKEKAKIWFDKFMKRANHG